MMGARGSPRVTSDLSPGSRVRFGSTRGMGIRTGRLCQCVLTGAQTTASAAATTSYGRCSRADGTYAAGCGTAGSTGRAERTATAVTTTMLFRLHS